MSFNLGDPVTVTRPLAQYGELTDRGVGEVACVPGERGWIVQLNYGSGRVSHRVRFPGSDADLWVPEDALVPRAAI